MRERDDDDDSDRDSDLERRPPKKVAKPREGMREEAIAEVLKRLATRPASWVELHDFESVVFSVCHAETLTDGVGGGNSSVLSHVVSERMFEMLEVLLSAGVDVNPPLCHPLSVALDPRIVELLLLVGADHTRFRDAFGLGCLGPGEFLRPDEALENAQTLLCHGADVESAVGMDWACELDGKDSRLMLELFETEVQAGASGELVADVFWEDLNDVLCPERLGSALGLPGVIDARTRELCQKELGVRFESLGEMVAHLNDPHLGVVLSDRAMGYFRPLVHLSFSSQYRPLIELLLFSGYAVRNRPLSRGGPVDSPLPIACLFRGDDCEMVQLLLCAGVPYSSYQLVIGLKTKSLGPEEFKHLGIASSCLEEWRAFRAPYEHPLIVFSHEHYVDILEQLLLAVSFPEQLLCQAIAFIDCDPDAKALHLLMDNCSSLDWRAEFRASDVRLPLLSARPYALEEWQKIRLFAQCGVFLGSLCSVKECLLRWEPAVRANQVSCAINDTETIFLGRLL